MIDPTAPPDPEMNRRNLGAKLIAEATAEELGLALRDRYDAIVIYGISQPEKGATRHYHVIAGDPVLLAGALAHLTPMVTRRVMGQVVTIEERSRAARLTDGDGPVTISGGTT